MIQRVPLNQYTIRTARLVYKVETLGKGCRVL